MKIIAEVWIVPVCNGFETSWILLPKAYTKKCYAISGGKAYQRTHNKNALIAEPVKLSTEIELPDCDACQHRFKCYTNR